MLPRARALVQVPCGLAFKNRGVLRACVVKPTKSIMPKQASLRHRLIAKYRDVHKPIKRKKQKSSPELRGLVGVSQFGKGSLQKFTWNFRRLFSFYLLGRPKVSTSLCFALSLAASLLRRYGFHQVITGDMTLADIFKFMQFIFIFTMGALSLSWEASSLKQLRSFEGLGFIASKGAFCGTLFLALPGARCFSSSKGKIHRV